MESGTAGRLLKWVETSETLLLSIVSTFLGSDKTAEVDKIWKAATALSPCGPQSKEGSEAVAEESKLPQRDRAVAAGADGDGDNGKEGGERGRKGGKKGGKRGDEEGRKKGDEEGGKSSKKGGKKEDEKGRKKGDEEGGKKDKGRDKDDDNSDDKGDDVKRGHAMAVSAIFDLPYFLAVEGKNGSLVWPYREAKVIGSSEMAPGRVAEYRGIVTVTEGAVEVDATRMKTRGGKEVEVSEKLLLGAEQRIFTAGKLRVMGDKRRSLVRVRGKLKTQYSQMLSVVGKWGQRVDALSKEIGQLVVKAGESLKVKGTLVRMETVVSRM
jgi:hypothetical protein